MSSIELPRRSRHRPNLHKASTAIRKVAGPDIKTPIQTTATNKTFETPIILRSRFPTAGHCEHWSYNMASLTSKWGRISKEWATEDFDPSLCITQVLLHTTLDDQVKKGESFSHCAQIESLWSTPGLHPCHFGSARSASFYTDITPCIHHQATISQPNNPLEPRTRLC